MKTIHCDIYVIEDMRREDILPPIHADVPEGMSEVKAAHFILGRAAEALPREAPDVEPHRD